MILTRLAIEPSPRVAENPRPQRRLEDEDVTRLVAEYVAGTPIAELARAWKIHLGTVVDHLDRRGVCRRHDR